VLFERWVSRFGELLGRDSQRPQVLSLNLVLALVFGSCKKFPRGLRAQSDRESNLIYLVLASNLVFTAASLVIRDDSGGLFLAVTCGNGHIVLTALNYSFWCTIVWDSIMVNLSSWEIISDLAVTHA
jgi:hypothetical protein